jgi:hypothetical protein
MPRSSGADACGLPDDLPTDALRPGNSRAPAARGDLRREQREPDDEEPIQAEPPAQRSRRRWLLGLFLLLPLALIAAPISMSHPDGEFDAEGTSPGDSRIRPGDQL